MVLNKIKKNCYIINTSRGEIVNEQHIIASLESGSLKGYATDVIEDEYTNRYHSPILEGVRQNHNIIVTPHVGGMTWEGQQKAYMWSISKLKELKDHCEKWDSVYNLNMLKLYPEFEECMSSV